MSMDIKSKLQTAVEDKLIAIVFRKVVYLRTFSTEEFKATFNLDKIHVKKHPSGFIFFDIHNNIGLATTTAIPTNPVISLVVDQTGYPTFILHERGVTPETITISAKRAKPDNNLQNSTFTRIYEAPDYEDYLMDAFDGDSDAYWNID